MRTRYVLLATCFVGLMLGYGLSAAMGESVFSQAQLEAGFRYREAKGLWYEGGVVRRDNSDVIKVGDLYYVWYTKSFQAMPRAGYNASVWYAVSQDGKVWTEKGEAVPKGGPGTPDEGSVFTPNILPAQGKYYLFYDVVRRYRSREELDGLPVQMHVAIAESPDGPWKKFEGNPVLVPSKDPKAFDSFRVDDSSLLVRDGKYWLYYKGRQQGLSPRETKMGLAIADKPTGPFIKYKHNPVVASGHEVMVWPYREGVATIISNTGPQMNTLQYAPDGMHFTVIAKMRNLPKAPGSYCPDAFTNTAFGRGITWGISMVNHAAYPYLVRHECDLSVHEVVGQKRASEKQPACASWPAK